MDKPKASDVRLAKLIAGLTQRKLEVHVPKNAEPFFAKAEPWYARGPRAKKVKK